MRGSLWGAMAVFAAQIGLVTDLFAEPVAPPGDAETRPEGAPARSDARIDQPRPEGAGPTAYHGEPFFLDAALGWKAADLTTFRSSLGANSFTANVIPAQASGPAAELGVGVRFYSLTLGLRGTVAWLGGDPSEEGAQMYTVDGEIGLRIPFDRVEGSLILGGGYSVIGGLSDAINGVSQGLDIDGGNARLALGVDYFVSKYLSVGVRATGELLFLARHGSPLRNLSSDLTSFQIAQNQLLAGDGSTVGTAFGFTVGPGLHF